LYVEDFEIRHAGGGGGFVDCYFVFVHVHHKIRQCCRTGRGIGSSGWRSRCG
jgi:hypothetical protein